MANSESPVEVTDEARERAKEMAKSYEDRPTAVLPASENTMTGTAVSEWLDEDGNSKFDTESQSDGASKSGGSTSAAEKDAATHDE